MEFKLNINMDNSAFTGSNGQEVARILRELANKIDELYTLEDYQSFLRDINGNRVGSAEVIA